MERIWNAHMLLIKIHNDAVTLEKSFAISQAVKYRTTALPSKFIPKHVPKKIKMYIYTKTYLQIFIAKLVIIVKSGNNINVHQL